MRMHHGSTFFVPTVQDLVPKANFQEDPPLYVAIFDPRHPCGINRALGLDHKHHLPIARFGRMPMLVAVDLEVTGIIMNHCTQETHIT